MFEPLYGFSMVPLGFLESLFALPHWGTGLLSDLFEGIHGDFEGGEEFVGEQSVDQHEVGYC